MALLEYRIHANYSAGAGWRWEVTAQDRDMIARGIAETHAEARSDMMRAVASSSPVRKSIWSTRVLTLHLNWYGAYTGFGRRALRLPVLPTRSLTIGGTSRAADAG